MGQTLKNLSLRILKIFRGTVYYLSLLPFSVYRKDLIAFMFTAALSTISRVWK